MRRNAHLLLVRHVGAQDQDFGAQEVQAKDQEIQEETDERLDLFVLALCHGRADDDVILPAHPLEQYGEHRQRRGEGGGPELRLGRPVRWHWYQRSRLDWLKQVV